MTEEWRQVGGYEGRYAVSTMGRIKSIRRQVRKIQRDGSLGLRWIKERILSLGVSRAGYQEIVLINTLHVRKNHYVHRLVSEAFIENPKHLPQVNHIDSDRRNNVVSNLEWSNQSHNVSHAYKMGNRSTGKKHHFSILKRDGRGMCVSKQAEVCE